METLESIKGQIEGAMHMALMLIVFEYNDKISRDKWHNAMTEFLSGAAWNDDGFDYRVICDETNNTQDVIDNFQFIGTVYFKTKDHPNFFQLNITAEKTGISFDELMMV